MCDLVFIKVSDIVSWGEGIINIVHKNNPKATKIVDNALYVREDVVGLVAPQIAQESKAEILRRNLREGNKKEKK